MLVVTLQKAYWVASYLGGNNVWHKVYTKNLLNIIHAALQVKTFIDMELAYINTNHPDFIGYAE